MRSTVNNEVIRLRSADAGRNYIPNIRTAGLSYSEAAHRLDYLLTAARHRRLSGVDLKDEAGVLRQSESVTRMTRNFLTSEE